MLLQAFSFLFLRGDNSLNVSIKDYSDLLVHS